MCWWVFGDNKIGRGSSNVTKPVVLKRYIIQYIPQICIELWCRALLWVWYVVLSDSRDVFTHVFEEYPDVVETVPTDMGNINQCETTTDIKETSLLHYFMMYFYDHYYISV